MKFVIAMVLGLLMVPGIAASATPVAPLPGDSVYQLPLPLTDQHGKHWDWSSRRGQPQLVAVFCSSCRYICPLIVDSGKAVDHALTPAQRAGLGVMFISMDARRDTPAALMRVATERNVDPRWSLGTPQAEDVRSVAGLLGIKYRELEGGDFNHTSALILLDADGRIVARTEKMGTQLDPAFLAAVRKLL